MPPPLDEHEISICPAAAGGDLQRFLHRHWRKGHVLAASRRLLDWQHLDRRRGRYNFVVARGGDGGIDAVLGYIPTSQFDPALEANGDVWLAIWKVRDGVQSAGLGLSLLNCLVRDVSPRSISAIGLNPAVAPIYRCLGYTVGRLDHYYMVNRGRPRFSILGGFDGRYDSGSVDDPAKELVACMAGGGGQVCESWPEKTAAYIQARYADHPAYRYEFFAIEKSGSRQGLLVVRRATCFGRCALRIVDFVGRPDSLAGCRGALQALLARSGAEYADFYCHGVGSLETAGFLRRATDSPVIVPNYFEPFERRNVELEFACKRLAAGGGSIRIVKGDSDQDRPSSPASVELAA